jgi:hypothetical protein
LDYCSLLSAPGAPSRPRLRGAPAFSLRVKGHGEHEPEEMADE